MVWISAFAFTTFALSPNGTTLITTIAASSPRMTMTTINSTRVNPSSSSRRRSGVRISIVTSLSGKGFELQDRQQDRQHDRRDYAAHNDDDRGFEQRQSGRGKA